MLPERVEQQTGDRGCSPEKGTSVEGRRGIRTLVVIPWRPFWGPKCMFPERDEQQTGNRGCSPAKGTSVKKVF
jgi:hypothetical protein